MKKFLEKVILKLKRQHYLARGGDSLPDFCGENI